MVAKPISLAFGDIFATWICRSDLVRPTRRSKGRASSVCGWGAKKKRKVEENGDS